MLLNSNETITEIVKEAALLDSVEQNILLTKLRVKRLKNNDNNVVINMPKKIKKPTLKQIDKWKHEARRKA